MPYVTVNAARLYYEQSGIGPDLVFLHGAGGNHLVWWQQVAEFSKRFRCTTFDARGWGLSRGEMAVGRFSLGTDLVALLEHLGIEKTHVIAQSMGGRSVAGLCRLAPQKAMSFVLCGTTAGATDDRIRELQDELKEERGDGGLREHSLAPGYEEGNPAMAFLYREMNSLNPPRPKGMLGRPPSTYRGSTHEMIAALKVPVLYIVGEHDLITSPAMIRQAQGLIAGAEFHEVKGAGHSCYFERAEEWNRVVGGFLDRVSGGPTGK